MNSFAYLKKKTYSFLYKLLIKFLEILGLFHIMSAIMAKTSKASSSSYVHRSASTTISYSSYDRSSTLSSQESNEGHISSNNYCKLVKPTPFLKYPSKRVSILDVPNRHVNLSSLDIYQFEPDSPASPGFSDDESLDTDSGSDISERMTVGILKKSDDSRFVRKNTIPKCYQGYRKKVTIIESMHWIILFSTRGKCLILKKTWLFYILVLLYCSFQRLNVDFFFFFAKKSLQVVYSLSCLQIVRMQFFKLNLFRFKQNYFLSTVGKMGYLIWCLLINQDHSNKLKTKEILIFSK